MQSAAEIFGGKDALLQHLKVTIRGTRMGKGWSAAQTAKLAGVQNSDVIDALENGTTVPPRSELLAVLDALGLSLQNVLNITGISEDDRRYWREEMSRRGVTLLAAAHGTTAADSQRESHNRWALELFVRLEALSELCSPDVLPTNEKWREAGARMKKLLAEQSS